MLVIVTAMDWLGLGVIDVILWGCCALVECLYRIYNPYMEVEHDLYKNNRYLYYALKYSRWLISFVLLLYVYTCIETVMKKCMKQTR